jgi:hypothetical protein
VLYHDDVEQLFFAAEVVVDKGQVVAAGLSNIAGACSGIAFLCEHLAGGLFYLFFGRSVFHYFFLLLHKRMAKVNLKI